MPLDIRDEEVDRLAEKLASRAGVSKAEAVRLALVNEIDRREHEPDAFTERVRRLQDEFASYPATGLAPDKAFYDSLNDE